MRIRLHDCLTVILCILDVEGYERLSVDDGLLEVAWFCACKLCGSLAGDMNVSLVVVGESVSGFA
jgi:hypothetical protein